MKEFVYILPNVTGGVASVVSNLIRYTTHPEIHKKVILIGDAVHPCDVNFDGAEVIVEPSPRIWSENKIMFVKRIARHLTAESIIISNDGYPEFMMVKILRLNNPIIAILHGDCSHYFNECKRNSCLIDRMLCVSSYLQQKAIQQIGKEIKPIFIPFPTPEIKLLEAKSYEDSLNLVYSGRITEAKGCEHFPALIDLLDNTGVDYVFHILGDGILLDSLIRGYANHPRIKIYGQLPNKDVLKILQKMHITVHLSKKEGLPVCLVESMKCGSVPVVFDLPTGIPDIIQDGINGFRIEQGNLNGILNAIQKLYNNRHLLRKMSYAAISMANNMFNAWEETKKYENLFLSSVCRGNKFSDRKNSLMQIFLNYLPLKIYYFIVSRFRLQNRI